ncbi:hypothetical protein PN838_06025 [Psychrosphaera sp. G1-22]|uniref:Uncharacterized protein n=1 Tax=Psychrosphaera algicola TaxID=3023714 RepID=A0ABT5FAG7_9GAMM|nr:hypothetical protein [Psychrosphaera sp. G1-22]MDC2888401.1 hypothetical protein [Psychrosphaera sp. G1-22]
MTNAVKPTLNVPPATPNKPVLSVLAATTCNVVTGCINNNSNELRSRSPALLSIAVLVDETNTATKIIMPNMPNRSADLELGELVSFSSTCIAFNISGDMPRDINFIPTN